MRERWPAQIEDAMLQAQLFGRLCLIVDGKRRRFRAIEDLDARSDHLDVTRGQLRILLRFGALFHFAVDAHDEFAAQFFRSIDDISRHEFLVSNDLHDTGPITKIDEDELTEVALLLHPAVESDLLPDVFFAKGSGVDAIHARRYSFLYST